MSEIKRNYKENYMKMQSKRKYINSELFEEKL